MKIIRVIFLLFHLILAMLSACVFLNAYISPDQFAWLNLLSLGFPVFMIAYLCLTVFWIFSGKKRAVFFILLGLIFLNPVKRWINYSKEKEISGDLKIITFNAKGAKFGKDRIEDFVNRQNADLVFLQEDGDTKYNFTSLQRNSKIPVNSLYSQYETVAHKDLFYGLHNENFNAYAQQTDLRIKGRIYRIINVYLQPFKFEKEMVKLEGNQAEDKQKVKNIIGRLLPTFKIHQQQIKIVRKSIDESPYPVILAGDFNSVPNSYEYYALGKNLQDAFFIAGNGSATSFHEYKFPIRIDYIFTSESVQPVSYRIDRSAKLSDHFPVIATFRLQP